MTKGQSAIAALVDELVDRTGNLPSLPGIFPDYAAPIIRRMPDGGLEMSMVRWGMPSSRKALLEAATRRADKLRGQGKPADIAHLVRMEPDRGTTNVRNTDSAHWRPFLHPARRCLVPFTSFSEPDQVGGTLKPIWFALNPHRPIAFFAGVFKRDHTSVRKVRDGECTTDLFAFLTTAANREVGSFHSKAMPVILTEKAERDLWMSDAPWEGVRSLQRPLADGALAVVAEGVRQDEGVLL